MAHVELPLAHGGDPFDDVEEEPGTPAASEHKDDHQQHLDDLFPALIDLLRLVVIAFGLLLEEGSLRRGSAHGCASSLFLFRSLVSSLIHGAYFVLVCNFLTGAISSSTLFNL